MPPASLRRDKTAYAAPVSARPLCVDLDGTLVNTDIFFESLLQLIKKKPKLILELILAFLFKGKAHLKWLVSMHAKVDSDQLPYNKALVKWLEHQHRQGRKIYLVTGSQKSIARSVSERFPFFSGVYASNGSVNLTAKHKAFFLQKKFGKGKFDYIGNSLSDIPVWQQAYRGYAININPWLFRYCRARHKRLSILRYRNFQPRKIIKALRTYQWAKNVLVFCPVLLAQSFELMSWVNSLITFVAFSLVASSGYIFNDLLDVTSDREHEFKRKRPFASGALSINFGLTLFPILLVLSLLTASLVSPAVMALIFVYFCLTVSYTLYLKRLEMIDVIVLAGFYTMRMFAGAVAAEADISPWLFAFSSCFFLSLALVKRCSELLEKSRSGQEGTISRGYINQDQPQLRALGSAAGFMAVMILGLYIFSEAGSLLYARPAFLWFNCILLTYWISRLWLLTSRGQMHYDPLYFAAKDKPTYVIGLCMFLFWLLARG